MSGSRVVVDVECRSGLDLERSSMSVPSDVQESWPQTEARKDADVWADHASDFVLIAEGRPPSRIELARERMLICRLYLGLLRTITDDYGTQLAVESDSLTLRTIGIYVFLRTVMCSRARAQTAARSGAETSARAGEGWFCRTRRQCLSRHRQGEISDLQTKLQRRI